ncbi:glycosyltransferase [Prosthecobacter sp.]|uniref:glycosyltransferase n=1 Tax=Prosthecobacter sp. TaxID=1965333 RepID=UPI0024876051|nr:glycosyltransferase [Prosthecobacter sp.]MDI1312339.1 glycosyltransferase [Prosthecobacter sp.]
MPPATVHLVIPCYQESGRIGPFLTELCEVTHQLGAVTVQVVEDGSDSAEAARMRGIITPLCHQYEHLLPPLFLPQNLGKGGAVYAGWDQAPPVDWLAFVDADGSCSATEVAHLIRKARQQPAPLTAIFASRWDQTSTKVQRQWKRRLMGRIFGTLVSTLLHIPIHDSQCGLKLVPRSAYQRIAPNLRILGFAFDVELLAALHDSGCEFEEVSIAWHETPGGHVHLIRDSIRMARDVLAIRKRRAHKK